MDDPDTTVAAARPGPDAGVTTGVSGRPWRATVTPWGAVVPWDDPTVALDWYVAADDRWHVPAREPSVRQRRIDDTPVTETRVRVPTGDAVQRVVSVAHGPGYTVVEVENESTLPIAVAFDRRDVRTERPIAEVPIEGIELPPGAFVVPVGHRSTVRVALAHDGSGAGPLPAGLPHHLQVVRGWQQVIDRAARYVLPDGARGAAAASAARAWRCELALGNVPHADDDPAAFLVALGELVRMGDDPDPWLPELVDAVAAVGPQPGWRADAALAAAVRVLRGAGESRAERDLDRILARRQTVGPAGPDEPPGDVLAVPWLERRLADGTDLLPAGLPPEWWGSSIEVYGVPVGRAATVSFALRWHGERPAVLWEVAGDEPVVLRAPHVAPGWSTDQPTGEALWPAPVGAPAPPDDEPGSFS